MTATRRRAGPLETLWLDVPEHALDAFEAALATVCATVAFYLQDEELRLWRLEGVRDRPEDDTKLHAALAVAAAVTRLDPTLHRASTEADGWLARTQEAFPDQRIGRRFLVRGTHSATTETGRLTLTLDAGLAFGTGEHGSTRGCLRALEDVARRRPRTVLDLGTGSGILAMAAARLLHRRVLASDIEPRSVRVARENAAANHVGRQVRVVLSNGWNNPVVRRHAPYDLVFANILARPLCAMAGDLARHLKPGGTAILSGLLDTQRRLVMSAHRRHGVVLERTYAEGRWTTLTLRKLSVRGRTPNAARRG